MCYKPSKEEETFIFEEIVMLILRYNLRGKMCSFEALTFLKLFLKFKEEKLSVYS